MNLILLNAGKPGKVRECADDICWSVDFVRSYCRTISKLLADPEDLRSYAVVDAAAFAAAQLIGSGSPEVRAVVPVHPHDILMRCHRILPSLERQCECYRRLLELDPHYARHFALFVGAGQPLFEAAEEALQAAAGCLKCPGGPAALAFTQALSSLAERTAAYLGATALLDRASFDIQSRDRAVPWN